MQLEFTSTFGGIFGLRAPRAPFWAPIFTYLKSTECQLSLEQKIIVVSFLEIFLAPCEYECCEKSIFGAPEPHSGLQN